jgi:exodeoxyribonuclease VII small subunit
MAGKSKNKFDFNQGLAELEQLIKNMERGDLTLDESLKNFEKGVELSRKCKQALDDAEQKIITLSADSDYQA